MTDGRRDTSFSFSFPVLKSSFILLKLNPTTAPAAWRSVKTEELIAKLASSHNDGFKISRAKGDKGILFQVLLYAYVPLLLQLQVTYVLSA